MHRARRPDLGHNARMDVAQVPALVTGVNICAYWTSVGYMVVRVDRKSRGMARLLAPSQPRERIMVLVWVPLVIGWMLLPLVAAGQPPGAASIWALPAWTGAPAVLAWRWAATALAVGCWLASIACWRHMGCHWRMAVDPQKPPVLLTDGPFAIVRHPIYALSILMMACTAVVTPTPLMLLLAVVHITLMHLKARNEEAFMQRQHGDAYNEYCRRVGRFVPRWRVGPDTP